MLTHFIQTENLFAEAATAQWFFTFEGVVLDLLLFYNPYATTLANHLHVHTIIEFMCPEQ